MLALDVIFLDETYPPALLVHKARRLRITTGNRALHAHHKETDYRFKDMTDKYLFRLFRLLVTPICFFVTLYAVRVWNSISQRCFIPSGISRNSRLERSRRKPAVPRYPSRHGLRSYYQSPKSKILYQTVPSKCQQSCTQGTSPTYDARLDLFLLLACLYSARQVLRRYSGSVQLLERLQ
jgi:hypothetical protein